LGSPAAAIEFWDDRIAIHGFYGMQVRSIANNFDYQDGWDLTQWYHILNLEIEADIAPDGIGPLDLVSLFGRIEIRYDCVWTRGCGIFSSANTYGDRPKRLPERLLGARRSGYTMQAFTGDTRRFRQYTDPSQLSFNLRDLPTPSREPLTFSFIPGLENLSASTGPDGVLGTNDDPFPYYTYDFMNPKECLFGVQRRKGSAELVGDRNLPHTPACEVVPNAALADKANPLSARDFSPVIGGFGSGELPFRPVPKVPAGPRKGRGEVAQGVWLPNYKLAGMLRDDKFGSFDQNFTQKELSWNHGASQQDEKELKELYADIELFDSRLWLRIGKQNIVWGKTELFRTTDQFNPQDLALGSLTSLEESRIGLWALRAVWSFYTIGPLEDVRLEVAVNYDEFEPTDIGRCGEPYAPLPVCDKTWGLMAHGFVGFAIAGEERPPHPWNSWSGIEVGGRLEWRWDRYSFAITDFYGYNDGAYVDPIFSYSRNVDPLSGRPRWGMETGPCRTGKEGSCLKEANALTHHSVAQTYFHFICATSIGFSTLDLTACGQSVYNSQNPALEGGDITSSSPTIAVTVGTILAGMDANASSPLTGGGLFLALAGYGPPDGAPPGTITRSMAQVRAMTAGRNGYPNGASTPLVSLVTDSNNGYADWPNHPIPFQNAFTFWGMGRFLSDEQQALLGCGPFYGTDCEIDGMDLMNSEASASIQSWPLFEGTFDQGTLRLTTDARFPQPGTTGFNGGPVCTRYEGGKTFILPGCRGPGDLGYNKAVDGSTEGRDEWNANLLGGGLGPDSYQRVHPFTGQKWGNEMAIISWNLLMTLAALSLPEDPNNPKDDEFAPNDPFRTNGCSFAAPQFCSVISAYNAITGVRRNAVIAGGNGRFGRRDFNWHGGGDLALRYEKRNVLGFSMDFAEDFTKSNWSMEFTWIEGLPYTNHDKFTNTSIADTYNLTLSMDRPTFVNFLNQNRTLFFNTQWFFQYVNGYERSFAANGPWNVLATFTVSTGYFQDRLLPSLTFVYDFGSVSGGILPEVLYRLTENLSAAVGLAGFFGSFEKRVAPLYENSLGNRVGRGAYNAFVENGLAAIRERDELWLRIRYTF
jgi:hypothetical protein